MYLNYVFFLIINIEMNNLELPLSHTHTNKIKIINVCFWIVPYKQDIRTFLFSLDTNL